MRELDSSKAEGSPAELAALRISPRAANSLVSGVLQTFLICLEIFLVLQDRLGNPKESVAKIFSIA